MVHACTAPRIPTCPLFQTTTVWSDCFLSLQKLVVSAYLDYKACSNDWETKAIVTEHQQYVNLVARFFRFFPVSGFLETRETWKGNLYYKWERVKSGIDSTKLNLASPAGRFPAKQTCSHVSGVFFCFFLVFSVFFSGFLGWETPGN